MMFFSRRLFSLPYMGESFNKTLFYLILSMARVSGGQKLLLRALLPVSDEYILVYSKKGVLLMVSYLFTSESVTEGHPD